jgi:hypothetical protein
MNVLKKVPCRYDGRTVPESRLDREWKHNLWGRDIYVLEG